MLLLQGGGQRATGRLQVSVLLVSSHLSLLYLVDAAMCGTCTCKPCKRGTHLRLWVVGVHAAHGRMHMTA